MQLYDLKVEMMNTKDERAQLVGYLMGTFTLQQAETVLQRYEATFQCERYSETWYDCESGTAKPDYTHVEWCRTCVARREIGVEVEL